MQENEHNDIGENVIRIAMPGGQSLLSLSISREVGQHITSAFVQATPLVNIDGGVSAMFNDDFRQTNQPAAVALDQLVADAVAPKMLEDEPDVTQMLTKFRLRLLKSLEYVDQAIKSLPKL